MSSDVTRLGWIGLGRIGAPMAGQLVKHGHQVMGWDISSEALNAGTKLGVTPAASLADVAVAGGVYFLCLSGPDAVEAVVFSEHGLAAAPADGAIVVDHSTIDPQLSRELADRAAEAGIAWVDMPISGGVELARAGNLIAWAGGADDAINAVGPLVSCYVSKLSLMGASGRGQLAKSCNQMIVAGTIALWSEMLRYAAAAGLDPVEVIETLEGGATDSQTGRNFARALADGTVPAESIRNMIKDLSAALNTSAANGFSPDLARAALEEFRNQIGAGS